MRRLTTEEFIEACREVHNNFYDYTDTVYTRGVDSVSIRCPTHGEFSQVAAYHKSGNGCQKCGDTTKSHEQFMTEVRRVHGSKHRVLDRYVNNKTKMRFECETHGVWKCKPLSYLSGKGCPTCVVRKSHADFVKQVQTLQPEYKVVGEYTKSCEPVDIECHQHGIWSPTANDLLSGSECPKCARLGKSKGESAIVSLLDSINVEYSEEFAPEGCIDKGQLRFDFYLPDHNLLIEYDGRQHYDPRAKWHTPGVVRRDQIKDQWTKDNGFRLIRFRQIEAIDCLHTILNEREV